MNRLFLSIGVLLVLVLTAALVVPLFVDWSAYRQTFEEQASALLGRRVQVSGATDLRLLPTPTIRFEGVEVAGAEGAPALLTAERFEAVLSIAPFLKGEIEVLDLVVERPVLRLPLGPDGALLIGESRPSGPFTVDLAAISVEAASISEGAIILILPDGTQRPLAGEVRAGLSAPSAIGPWRLDAGSLRLGDGEIVDFRAATGTAEDGAIRLRFSAYPAQTPVIVEADGALSLSGGLPRYDGEAVLRSAMEGGWRLVSGFELTPDRLRAENLTWSLQTGEGPAFEIAGHAVVALADPPRFEAVLSSRQIDLDRLFGGGPADPSASFEAVRHFLAGLPPLPVQGVVSADLPAIVVGGSVIRDIGFDVQLPGDGSYRVETFEATLPGDGQLSAEGQLTPSAERIFAGRVALSSERAGTLIAWARQEEGETPTDPGFSSFDLSADLAVTQDGITLDRIRGDIADAPVTGDIGLVRMPDARELRIDLDAGVLSADLVTGIAGLIARDGRGNGEVPTRLVAEVTAQRLTVGGFDLGEVDAALTFERDRLDLRQLVIGNVGGARLAAEGQLETLTTAPAGTIRAGLDADEVGGLLTLAGRLFPQSELVADLRRNAPLYAPARLSLHYDGAVDDGAARMLLEGDVSGSVLSFAAERTGGAASDPAASSLTARLSVEGESAFRLLSQAGLALFPTGVDTPGTLVLSLDGVPREGLETALSFEGLGGRFSYDGTVLLDGGAPQLSGALSFRHDDVGPLGLMAGISLPILPGGLPVTLAGDVSGTFDALSLSRIDARILDARATGYLERRRPASGPSAISGQLALDGIDLELLALALFGPEALDPVAGTRLPGGLFSPLLLDDESVGVHITAPRARLADDSVLTGFAADLHLGAEGVALDAIEAGFAGGRVTGRLSVDMADLTPVLSARLALEGVDAAALSWQDGARAVIGGRLSAQVSLDGQGRSIAALAAALSGEGAFQLEDGRIEGLSPSAFARIVRASEAGLVEEDPQVNAAFAGQLASGGLDLPHLEGPLTIAGGTLRAASLGVETPEVALRGTLEVDLAEMDLSAGIQMTPRGAVSGLTLPGVALSFAGPVEAPERRLDTQQLTAALGVQRLEVEIERVEALNAEILERERLVRELSVIRAARQRIEAERQAEDAARQREAARQEEERRQEAARREREERSANTPVVSPQALGEALGGAGSGPSDGNALPPLDVIVVEPLPEPPVAPAAPSQGYPSGPSGLY